MDSNINNYVDGFLNEFKNIFPRIYIRVEYDEFDNSCLLYHSQSDIYENEFCKLTNELLKKYFDDNDIFVGFSYDYAFRYHYLDEDIKPKYSYKETTGHCDYVLGDSLLVFEKELFNYINTNQVIQSDCMYYTKNSDKYDSFACNVTDLEVA